MASKLTRNATKNAKSATPHKRTVYRVRYENDEDGYWQASVPAVPGCHTQARNLPTAEARIREALGLFVDDADAAILERHVLAPPAILKAISRFQKSREQRNRFAAEADAMLRDLLVDNTDLSLRDLGWLLDLSYQRIAQVRAELENPSNKPRQPARRRKSNRRHS